MAGYPSKTLTLILKAILTMLLLIKSHKPMEKSPLQFKLQDN